MHGSMPGAKGHAIGYPKWKHSCFWSNAGNKIGDRVPLFTYHQAGRGGAVARVPARENILGSKIGGKPPEKVLREGSTPYITVSFQQLGVFRPSGIGMGYGYSLAMTFTHGRIGKGQFP